MKNKSVKKWAAIYATVRDSESLSATEQIQWDRYQAGVSDEQEKQQQGIE